MKNNGYYLYYEVEKELTQMEIHMASNVFTKEIL